MVYVKVFVSDENDNPPHFYPREYAVSLSAQSTPGTAVMRVRAHDPDQGPHGRLSYHILSGNSPQLFALDEQTGEIPSNPRACPQSPIPHCTTSIPHYPFILIKFPYISLFLSLLPGLLTVAWPLTRRANSVVQLEVGAQDGGGLQAEPSARVNISIVPGTPTPPIFEQLQYVFSVPEDVAPGTSVGIIQAHNPPGII